MGAPFAVDLEQLDRTIAGLAAFETQLEAKLAEVDTRIGQLHGAWTGPAAAAQLAAHQEWLAGARQMREGLARLKSAAGQAHSNYSAAVRANTANWTF